MMERFDRYVKAIWEKMGLYGFIIIVAVILAVLVVAALVLGVDIGGYINRLLGVP
jgi:hypothetical protein